MHSASVGIIYKHRHAPAKSEAKKLEVWFKKKGIKVFSEEMKATESLHKGLEESSGIPKTVDWVVVLGGDGTLLGAARRVGRYGVPLLGVNLGGLGFLTGIPLKRLYPVIEMMIEGHLELETRIMLEAKVMRMGEEVCRFQVLNDVVIMINKGTLARIIDLDVTINEEFLTTFRADGLIISTATGSTAYNLAAGGPILYPTMETFVLNPICPFTLTNRPIIVPDTAVIQIKMGKESEETVLLTFDGQVGFDLHYGDEVIINKSQEKIKLLRPKDHSYFEILRTKLMWGGVTYNHADH
ncbi:MAG: NAD(+)/NADH kinase [Deltaproteobacteria bacterium]|nr:NAD(+)/NADH kinase [Deltaproteobacteria bacterium]MBW2117911.1 NAD(+)/NADH kinase [Deltaproteobacteria bacterium]MBW2345555.1 NAD(+)/NADH kinase [Deltaproteobacteria bacterium]